MTGYDLEQRLSALERELQETRSALRAAASAKRCSRIGAAAPAIATACIAAAFFMQDSGGVQAQAAPQALTVPFVVANSHGEPVLRIDEQGATLRGSLRVRTAAGAGQLLLEQGVLTIGEADKGGVTLGLGKSGTGFVIVRTDAGKYGVGIGRYNGGTMGTYVIGPDGTTPEASLALDSGSRGILTVGRADTGGAYLGVGASGTGFLLVRNTSGKDALRIGSRDGAPFSVSVQGADGTTTQASLGLDAQNKGILRIGDVAGARGVLGAARSGGMSFALYDTEGSDYRVGLLAAPDVSFVRLNSAKNAVHLNAEAGGAAVHVFNSSGNAAASLRSTASGFGQFSLGDPGGQTTVEAGTLGDGRGVVRAGPRMGGQVGLEGLPWAIMGKP